MIRAVQAGLLMLLAFAAPVRPVWSAASNGASNLHGSARLISAVEATGSGTQLDVGLQLRLSPGWHTYWRTPGDAGFTPSIDWTGSENLAGAEITWPAPRRLPPAGGLETIGYEDGVVLPIAIRPVNPGAPLHLHAEVDYASCKDICIPYHASLDLVLPSGLARPGPEAPLIAAARAMVPGNPDATRISVASAAVETLRESAVLAVRLVSTGAPFSSPDLFVEGVTKGSPGRPAVTLAQGGWIATLRVPIRGGTADAIAGHALHLTIVDGARAAETEAVPQLGAPAPISEDAFPLAIIGFALLGGLILNLMPCVLPVLSLKLLALVGYARVERQAARLGLLATAAGIFASFGALAAALIALKAAGAAIGWGIQFQQPWFLATMALATTLFAASLWDWLPIGLPGRLAGAVGSVHGRSRLGDAFLMGAFATVLAASCSAPFVGTALGFALARGPFEIALVFGALGLGMATPFLVIAAMPALVAWLPRPGPWMEWLRRALGVLLLGTAAWLISVLDSEAGSVTARVAGVALGLVLLTLGLRHRLLSARRITGMIAAALATVALLVPTLRGQAGPVEGESPAVVAAPWRPFDEAALHGIIAQGKILFVDVTAAWCLTCKANELAVLDRAPVADRLRDQNVVAMRADWTRPNPTITAYLQGFGRYGVPLDVIYGPGAPAGIVLPELLTPGVVMDAFERAAASPARRQEAMQ